MVVQGETFSSKEEAGKALLSAYMAGDIAELIEIGSYRGFTMFSEVRNFQRELVLKGEMTHRTTLGIDPTGALIDRRQPFRYLVQGVVNADQSAGRVNAQIAQHQGFIKGLEADMKTVADHPHPMVVKEKPAQAQVEQTRGETGAQGLDLGVTERRLIHVLTGAGRRF